LLLARHLRLGGQRHPSFGEDDMKHIDLKTAAGFLTERADFLHDYHVPSAMRDGWDVVLRVDGTYSHEADAIEAADSRRYTALDRVPRRYAQGRAHMVERPSGVEAGG
jgi:hypothetical protein